MMPSTRPTIRFAATHEGPIIQTLCLAKGARIGTWLDWSGPLAGNWLIAETDRPVGCLMLNYGVPIGHMEFLVIDPSIPFRTKALVARNLCYAAAEQLARHGSQAVVTSIDQSDHEWMKVVEKRGSIPIATGTIYIKRL